MPMVIEDPGTSSGFFSLFHDSWSAFPTFVIIDHTMTVRAKPWTLENNSNSSSCDGNNNTVNGWSGGSTENFLQQLVDECGDLCLNNGCNIDLGDVNEDDILNIQDLITLVNQILGIISLADCALEAADMNVDGIINIQDLISLVNSILGSGRVVDLNGHADVKYFTLDNDMIVQIISNIEIVGLQISINNHLPYNILLKNNSHIVQKSNFKNNITNYLAYSLSNQPFDGNTAELFIDAAGGLDMSNINITAVDINGDVITTSHFQGEKSYYKGPQSFELKALYPNPFNPSTEVIFNLPADSHIKLSVYDIKGQEVDIIFEGSKLKGSYNYIWNASNLTSGVYFVSLQSGSMIATQKALLVK